MAEKPMGPWLSIGEMVVSVRAVVPRRIKHMKKASRIFLKSFSWLYYHVPNIPNGPVSYPGTWEVTLGGWELVCGGAF
jgi:hypothetical protein